MNEEIKSLLDQATHNVLGVPQVNQNKFAELIINECIRLCDQVDLAGADDCIDNIKDHFGVNND